MDTTAEIGLYWSQPVEDVIATSHSSTDGLRSDDARQRLAQFGPNTIKARDRATALSLFLNQFKSPIILILLFATGVSAVLQEWVDAVIVLLIVLGSALLSFVQEYNANKAAEELRARLTLQATVLRDGQPHEMPAEEIVPGDVVLLSAGSLIPADGVLLETRDFYVNQTVLTGETFPVDKTVGPVAPGAGLTERTNCVFMGTNVRSGSARATIVQTGTATAFGQIAEQLSLRPPETEFERGIRRFGYLLTEVMLVLVLIVFAVNVFFHKPVIDSLLFSVALAVGLTPQLLPAIISINLQGLAAYGQRRGPGTTTGVHRELWQHGRAVHRQDGYADRGGGAPRCGARGGRATIGTGLSVRISQCQTADRIGQPAR